MKKIWTCAAALACGLIVAACADAPVDGEIVARAGTYTLTVDEAADLLVDQENLPNEIQVVRALAELWVDYTLLADAAARDSTLGSLDLEPVVRQQIEQEMIIQLRDSVIQVDTAISDSELRGLFETGSPDAEVRARHILLGFPEAATAAQRDSVRQALAALRARAMAGEAFGALAARYSQDPGTARLDGDLGFFGRGDMVLPFEEAAFALEPGEVSDVVETPYGLHLIKVEERRAPDFERAKAGFRVQVQSQRLLQAESLFVAGIEERADVETVEGVAEMVKQLTAAPEQRLSGRAARRPLMEHAFGDYTAGDYLAFVRAIQPQERAQIQGGTDDQIEDFLMGLVRRELIVEEARRAGLQPDRDRVDSLVADARERLLTVAGEIGVLSLDRAPGEDLEPAVDRAVNQSLADVLAGAKDVVPLGAIGFQLRQGETTVVDETGIGQVVLRVGRIRATRSPAPADQLPADTAGADGDTGN